MQVVFTGRPWRIMLSVLTILAFCSSLSAQENNITNTPTDNLIPPSPEAAALAKYAQIPVGLYTGTPQISIPIWELKEGDIKLDISLSYHASGIKVEEIASRVGAGWTLNAGGMVTRTAVGECDEYSVALTDNWNGIVGFFWGFGRYYTPQSMFEGSNAQLMERFQGINDCLDAEPDQFSFNFGSYTGQFAFNWGNSTNPSDRIVVSCSHKLKVEVVGMSQPGEGSFIQGFKITTEDGTIYEFEAKETTDIPNKYNPVRNCGYFDNNGQSIAPVNSWYLTRITSPNGHTVNFQYTPYNLQYQVRLSESINHKNKYDTVRAVRTPIIQPMTISGVYLSRIVTGSGNIAIDFNSGTELRQDLIPRADGSPNQLYSLKEIVVTNKGYQIVKKVNLNYDYSIGRLTLKNVQELPVDGSSPVKPPYSFAYNTNGTLPSLGVSVLRVDQQDHFGYYNSNPKTTLIPEFRAISDLTGEEFVWSGGNRSPDPDRMKAGVLTRITFPGGSSTSFEYEPHDYRYVGDSLVALNTIAGGLRIKKITDYDGMNATNNMVRKFEYRLDGTDSDKSSGVISTLPRYEYYTIVYTTDGPMGPTILLPCLSRVSSSVITLGTTQGSYIGYRRVTVTRGENGEGGKSVSSYTSFYDQNDDYTFSFKQPFPQATGYDFRRGLTTKQVDYKYQANSSTPYVPVKETSYEYDSVATSIFGLKVGEVCSGCRLNPTWRYDTTRPAALAFPYGLHWLALGNTKPRKITETLFENNSSYTVEHGYTYDAGLHFVQTETFRNSEGKQLITQYSYPFNYTSAPYDIVMMQYRHMLSPVIEKIVKERSANGTERVIDAAFTQYSFANNKILPLQSLKFSSLTPAVSFTPSTLAGGWFDLNYYTNVAVYDRYNNKGNVQQITTPGNTVNSYIWGGFDTSQLLAKITNATFDRCAYTSFENTDNEGNWNFNPFHGGWISDSKAGRFSFWGNISSNSNLPAGRYIVSLWAKSIGNNMITVNGITYPIDATWKRYEWVLTNPGTVTISTLGNYIDELRLHPAGAAMKTFVQEPGVGLRAVTDENHMTTYFDYDSFGRLKNIRDKDGNIRKNYSYHYKIN
jgi:YD repeat-containing protein